MTSFLTTPRIRIQHLLSPVSSLESRIIPFDCCSWWQTGLSRNISSTIVFCRPGLSLIQRGRNGHLTLGCRWKGPHQYPFHIIHCWIAHNQFFLAIRSNWFYGGARWDDISVIFDYSAKAAATTRESECKGWQASLQIQILVPDSQLPESKLFQLLSVFSTLSNHGCFSATSMKSGIRLIETCSNQFSLVEIGLSNTLQPSSVGVCTVLGRVFAKVCNLWNTGIRKTARNQILVDLTGIVMNFGIDWWNLQPRCEVPPFKHALQGV